MAGATLITIVGTLGSDPESRQAGNTTVVSFSVAVTERKRVDDQWIDDGTTWFRCSAWRDLGEHIAQSVHKGDQVIVSGRIKDRSYEKDGQTVTRQEVEVEEFGPSLRFATASVSKVGRNANQQRNQNRAQSITNATQLPQQAWSDEPF